MATVGLEQQQLLIGGRWTEANSGRTYEQRDPFSGEPAGTAAAAGREDARAAADAAQIAFPGWSQTPPEQRGEILQRASALLMERQQDIAAIVTAETGGTFGWGMFNVQLAAGMLAYYGAQAEAFPVQEIESHIPGKAARAVRQAVGV